MHMFARPVAEPESMSIEIGIESAGDIPLVPAPDPWASERPLETPRKRLEIQGAKPRKRSAAAAAAPIVVDDDEEESEDPSFDGHSSDSEDGGNDDDDGSVDGGGSLADDEPKEAPPAVNGIPVPLPVRASTVVPPPERRVRKTKKEQLAELQLRHFGRVEQDDGDEDDDGESLGSSGVSSDTDDIESDDDLSDGIVRDDAYRLMQALAFKHVAESVVPHIRPPQSFESLSLADREAERRKESLKAIVGRLGRAGVDATQDAPDLAAERDGNDDDSSVVEEPEESTVHSLVPPLIGMLERDEHDLPEMLGKLSQGIFSKVLLDARMHNSPSIALGKDIAMLWGAQAPACLFYLRCEDLLKWLVDRTATRWCNSLILAFASAFKNATLYEFTDVKYIVNELHPRHAAGYRCAVCSDDVAPTPFGDSSVLTCVPGVDLMQRKVATLHRNDGNITVYAHGLNAPTTASFIRHYIVCRRCNPLITIMNQLLTAPHDLVVLARAWIGSHRADIASTMSTMDLSNAFHGWDVRRDRCQSIIWAYKMLHAIALN